jgi:nitrogen fixation NifU-like protein
MYSGFDKTQASLYSHALVQRVNGSLATRHDERIYNKVNVMNDTKDPKDDFWQSHSLVFLEMAFRMDRRERLHQPDGYGKNQGECGDTVEFFLRVGGERIKAITYDLNGCLNTNACANAILDLVRDKSLEEAWQITPENVAAFLESLPEDHFHCAELAVGALYKALVNVRENQQKPWKKYYS